jgi:NAD(P)H-nitrite reductase large subunit
MSEQEGANNCCSSCHDGDYVCHCLCVNEDMIIEAILNGAFTVDDLRLFTDAGNGCTACHPKLREYLKEYGPIAAERQKLRVALTTV